MKEGTKTLIIILLVAVLGYAGYRVALSKNNTYRAIQRTSDSLKIVTDDDGQRSICTLKTDRKVCLEQRKSNAVVAKAGFPLKHIRIRADGKTSQSKPLFYLNFAIIMTAFLLLLPLGHGVLHFLGKKVGSNKKHKTTEQNHED